MNTTALSNDLTFAYKSVERQVQKTQLFDITQVNDIQPSTLDSQWIVEIVDEVLSEHNDMIKDRILQEFIGDGPLNELLNMESLTEIIVNGPQNIWYEVNGKFIMHNDQFLSKMTFNNYVQKILNKSNAQISIETPCVNLSYKNFRVHIISNPLAEGETCVTLRKHPESPWTLELLQKNSWASPRETQLIQSLLESKKNILIIGPTGSGKTSVLNALLQEVPNNERIICIEDTSEIKLPNPLSTKLLTRVDPTQQFKDYQQQHLVVEALRMRPQRIVMGEVRGPEAKDLLMALSTGHSGGLATLHAENAKQALWRLEMLIQMGAPYWNLHAIRSLIKLSLSHIIVLENKNRKRALEGVYKISSLEDFGFLLEKITCTDQYDIGPY